MKVLEMFVAKIRLLSIVYDSTSPNTTMSLKLVALSIDFLT
jgi:hypothetical protein